MKAIILAAGRGSRMRSLTAEKPKSLVEFRGKPLLEWQLDALKFNGINEIAIVTGYRRESFQSYGLVEFNNPRWAETQMVASLACASDWLESEPCVVSYSDIYYLSSGPRLLVECDVDLAITFDPNWLELWSKRFTDPLEDAETFRLDASGYVINIGEKPKSIDEVQGQYMGLLRFTPFAWCEINRIQSQLTANEQDTIDMTGLLQKVIEDGVLRIAACSYCDTWAEFDSITDLE